MRERVEEAADYAGSRIGGPPEVALVLGSGLGGLAEELEGAVAIPYGDIPHFPVSTAPGHAGRLVAGRLSGRSVVAMQGRFHFYEGYQASELSFAPRVLRRLGARVLVLTNAAGGVNLSFSPGDFMLLSDHLNLTGQNPLIGGESTAFGPLFPDQSNVYDQALRARVRRSAREEGVVLREGIYGWFAGPCFETPAEIRMARYFGADAVGMSTVPEAIAGAHCGMRVMGISLIANMAAGILPQPITAEEVLAISGERGPRFAALLKRFLQNLEG
ncbi:MAG: purine-nucleoside phosphorylase [Spirochaetia bacterium]|jgi:purine-nucleoside phosphorylase